MGRDALGFSRRADTSIATRGSLQRKESRPVGRSYKVGRAGERARQARQARQARARRQVRASSTTTRSPSRPGTLSGCTLISVYPAGIVASSSP